MRDGVTVQADPNATSAPVVQGFTITADNVTVDGFEITFQNNSTPGGYGVYLHGASNAVVENNYIHDLCHDGVRFDSTDSSNQVLNNRIVHAQESGITIDGAGNLIQGNEIWGTYQHPSVLGGIYAVCTYDGGSGSDADGIRFFGSNHIIRSNYIHDIEYDFGNSSLPNPNPHTDCFQTWGESGETTANILIDRNWCDWPSNGSQGAQGEVGSIEALDGPVGTLTFQNNVFQDMIRGLNATQDGGQTIGQLNFYNNTFDPPSAGGDRCRRQRDPQLQHREQHFLLYQRRRVYLVLGGRNLRRQRLLQPRRRGRLAWIMVGWRRDSALSISQPAVRKYRQRDRRGRQLQPLRRRPERMRRNLNHRAFGWDAFLGPHRLQRQSSQRWILDRRVPDIAVMVGEAPRYWVSR